MHPKTSSLQYSASTVSSSKDKPEGSGSGKKDKDKGKGKEGGGAGAGGGGSGSSSAIKIPLSSSPMVGTKGAGNEAAASPSNNTGTGTGTGGADSQASYESVYTDEEEKLSECVGPSLAKCRMAGMPFEQRRRPGGSSESEGKEQQQAWLTLDIYFRLFAATKREATIQSWSAR